MSGLAGLPPDQVRPLLTELTDSHLLSEHLPGRFTLHDLLRDYAAELALTHDRSAERHTAVRRLLDHCLHSAYRASLHLNPYRDDPITDPLPEPTVPGEDFADHQEALAWFTAEHAVLLAVQERAVSDELHAHAWQLAWTLMPYFDRGGHWHDSVAVHRRALEAARRQGSSRGRAVSHGCLAYAYMRLSRYEEVATHLGQALDLYEALDDPVGQAHAHRTMTWLGDRQGRYDEALVHARQALALFEAVGHRTGQARALNALGWFCSQLGRHEEGLHHCEQALRLLEATGDRFDQADTLDSLGHVHHRLDQVEEAAGCFRRALDLYQETGDRYNEADTLSSLGDVRLSAGDRQAAAALWRRALPLLEELGHVDAGQIRAKLAALHS